MRRERKRGRQSSINKKQKQKTRKDGTRAKRLSGNR